MPPRANRNNNAHADDDVVLVAEDGRGDQLARRVPFANQPLDQLFAQFHPRQRLAQQAAGGGRLLGFGGPPLFAFPKAGGGVRARGGPQHGGAAAAGNNNNALDAPAPAAAQGPPAPIPIFQQGRTLDKLQGAITDREIERATKSGRRKLNNMLLNVLSRLVCCFCMCI